MLDVTYKLFIRSQIDFAAPVYANNIKPSPLERLQRIQNVSLRLATGSHHIASAEYLHAEASMLPV